MADNREEVARQLAEYFGSMLNKSYEELVEETKMGIGRAYGILKQYGDDNKASAILSLFIVSAIASDGKLSSNEERLLNDVFGNTNILALARSLDQEQYQMLDSLIDHLPSEEKAVFCHLALTISAVDGDLDENELHYLLDLIA